MKTECRGYIYKTAFLCLLLAVSLAGCANPEKAKAEHVARGEAYLKESKFQEASLEFRNAIQIDDNFIAAHWGLARAFEGLERVPEMVDALRKTVRLDKNKENLEARVKLGNYYIIGSGGRSDVIAEAERLAKEILEKDPKHIEGHILMGGVLFNQNHKDEAFTELNHAVQLDPNRVESYLSLARFHGVNKEPAKAEELYKKAISVNDNSAVAHTEYGRFLVQFQRDGEAEAQFRKAVDVSPNDRSARFLLASYYLVNKQFDKAEEAFKAMAALQPDKPEGQTALGDFYASVGRFDEAIKIYQDIISKAPDYSQGRYRLGELLIRRGDMQGVNAQIDELLKKDKNDRQALLLRARVRLQAGQDGEFKKAIEDLNEVLKQEPNSRWGLYYMTQANLALGRNDQARTFASELEKNYPDDLQAKFVQLRLTQASGDHKGTVAMGTDLLGRVNKVAPGGQNTPQLLAEVRHRTHLARGRSLIQLQNFEGARQDFEIARQIAPNDPAVYNSLAMLSLAENKPEDAIRSFEAALSVDATNYDALNGLIALFARNREIEKAHAKVDQALSAYPNVATLHYLKAQAYGFQGNAAGVEAELNKALELDPNYLTAYFALGTLYINTKQEDRAIAEYQKIIAKKPESAVPYTLVGMLEYQKQNHDAAIENYRKALEVEPNSIIAANNLAWIYASTGKGNIDEALRLAQGVVQKNPNMAGFIDTLGFVLYKKNLHAAAIEQFRKAIALNDAEARSRNAPPSAAYRYHLAMALRDKGEKEEARREFDLAMRFSEKAPFPELDEAKKAAATF